MVKQHVLIFFVLASSISFSLVAMEMEQDPLHAPKIVRQRHEKNSKNTEKVIDILTGAEHRGVINAQQVSAIEHDDFYGQQRAFHCEDYCCLFGTAFVLGGALVIQKVYQHHMAHDSN